MPTVGLRIVAHARDPFPMTPDERHTARAALNVAAAQYRRDAATVRATAPGHAGIADHFDQQAIDAERLADRLT